MVKVYNGINLSSGELSRAEREAAKIFQFAGIQLTWTAGVLGPDVNDNTPSERWNTAFLQLRIWTRAMVGKKSLGSETLGLCISLENGDALVLADAIWKRAAFGTTDPTDLLGLAMAHELGHLLLRSARHSVSGIMRARWSEGQLRDDDRGYLRFTPGEAETMQNEVRRRTRLAVRVYDFGPELAARLSSVLEVIYLIFNEGYSATAGDDLIRPTLCEDALRLDPLWEACSKRPKLQEGQRTSRTAPPPISRFHRIRT